VSADGAGADADRDGGEMDPSPGSWPIPSREDERARQEAIDELLIAAHDVDTHHGQSEQVARVADILPDVLSPRRGPPRPRRATPLVANMARMLADTLYALARDIELGAALQSVRREFGGDGEDLHGNGGLEKISARKDEAEERVVATYLRFLCPVSVRGKQIDLPRFRRFCLVEAIMRATDYAVSCYKFPVKEGPRTGGDPFPEMAPDYAPEVGPHVGDARMRISQDDVYRVIHDLQWLDPWFADSIKPHFDAVGATMLDCALAPSMEKQWAPLSNLTGLVFGAKVSAPSLKADVLAIRKQLFLLYGGRGYAMPHLGISWALRFGVCDHVR
jgi:hypothetical protein